MRILFSTTNLDLGGAQMFIMRLAEEFNEQGHEVFVYNHQPEWSNNEFLSSFSKKIKILGYSENPDFISFTWKLTGLINKFNKKFIFRNWLNEKKYKETLRKYKFDIISSQMYASDKVNAKIAIRSNTPFVITNHGEYELNISNGNVNFKREAKECISRASGIIYTAEKNIESIRTMISNDKPLRKISIGFNGNAIKRFNVNPESLGIQKGDFVIGMVARGIPEKGWNELIEMFNLLTKAYTKRKLHLVLIGNGELLKQLVKERKTENMHLLQFEKNPMEYFSWVKHFDAGLLLSYFTGESVPNSIIEYLYHGVPVLSTPMGDIERMINSPAGMSGDMIPMKNGKADVNAAVNMLIKWLENPDYYQQLKLNTKSAFEKFEMKNIAKQYLEVYNNVVSGFLKIPS